jgi:uncharacterized membrane protein HdeD (DUF308 family)
MLQGFGRFWQVSPRPKTDLDLIGYVIDRTAYDAIMNLKSGKGLQSKMVVGILWLLGGLLMLIPPIFLDGNRTYMGIGAMFLILGIVSLARDRKNSDSSKNT